MKRIDEKYESWKNSLLDMGKKNRLLNYKENSACVVKITYPVSKTLYDMFVTNELPVVFPYEKEKGKNTSCSASNVETDKGIKELQVTLRNLRNKAKTVQEEQGVNALYLSFGFLRWTEDGYSYCSPLLLVPSTLIVNSLTSPFKLNAVSDDIVVNPTLRYKFLHDFGIALPEFCEGDELEAFFSSVSEAVALKKWEVTDEVSLSLLSFLKINMYEDLNKNKEKFLCKPLIRTIASDSQFLQSVPPELTDIDTDAVSKPYETYCIVDADSSQQEAIILAEKGISFTLQGPPGAGKSQTITNIIAQSLASGKKVLFVSEKMAALDVVYRKFVSAGLSDFCLLLHSHKASKKNVLSQLQKVLEEGNDKIKLSDDSMKKLGLLENDRDKLNEYVREIHDMVYPLEKTVYEANSIIASLDNTQDVIFDIEDIGSVTKEQYEKFEILISDFADARKRMSEDCFLNPWRDCTLEYVTNEFRHDVATRLSPLISKVEKADKESEEIFSQTGLASPRSISTLNKAAGLFELASDNCEIPENWVTGESATGLYDDIAMFGNISEVFGECREKLKECIGFLYGNGIEISIPENITEDYKIILPQKAAELEKLFEDVGLQQIKQTGASVPEKLLGEALLLVQEIKDGRKKLCETYYDGIFDIDRKTALNKLNSGGAFLSGVFSTQRRSCINSFRAIQKNKGRRLGEPEIREAIACLDNIAVRRSELSVKICVLNKFFTVADEGENTDFSEAHKKLGLFGVIENAIGLIGKISDYLDYFSERDEPLREKYQFLYKGIYSDWEHISEVISQAQRLKVLTQELHISYDTLKEICSGKDFYEKARSFSDRTDMLLEDISDNFLWFTSYFEDAQEFEEMPLSFLSKRLDACMNGMSLLEEWIDFRQIRESCKKEGLGDFISGAEGENISSDNLLLVFRKRFFRLWLDSIYPHKKEVSGFRRRSHEQLIDEFCELDRQQPEIARERIKKILTEELASARENPSLAAQISILKRELGKQRRLMPIRKLFSSIPRLLLTLKPCLMMSPLTVSVFLDSDIFDFDIVIFDEASQVSVENAVGAIARGRQVIIAGDSKQLPPTDFFHSTVNENVYDSETEDEEDYDVFESVLEAANMLPERTLKWHYRSRCEELIAFSNEKFYKNKLITFPSSSENTKDSGVEYIYVPDGIYEGTGRKCNIKEAEAVADEVFRHFRENPHRSLGVIAFGIAGQQTIEEVLRRRRLENSEYEEFFSESREEPFFVKNLESVQGDERDTIIFSIGYAKDSDGVFRMNFGPLNKAGGERRLNVAITRAKYNLKLIGSIKPEDIDPKKTSSEGALLLRSYMDFAINGKAVLKKASSSEGDECCEPSFENTVKDFLRNHGYKVSTQVGCSDFRVDIAVRHPERENEYILGIICDGKSSLTAKNARERERLRQEVLEKMGWSIYRLWSTEWIKDPVLQGELLLGRLKSC